MKRLKVFLGVWRVRIFHVDEEKHESFELDGRHITIRLVERTAEFWDIEGYEVR